MALNTWRKITKISLLEIPIFTLETIKARLVKNPIFTFEMFKSRLIHFSWIGSKYVQKQYFNICRIYHELWHPLNININIRRKLTKLYIFTYMLNMLNKGNMFMYIYIYNYMCIRIYEYYFIPSSVLGILGILHKDANVYIEGCIRIFFIIIHFYYICA